MKRPRAKTVLVAFVGIAVLVTTAFVVHQLTTLQSTARRQRLGDGTVLALKRVAVGSHLNFSHGSELAKILGNAVASNGIHILHFDVNRRTEQKFDEPEGRSWLAAEFSVSGPNASNNPFAKPAFYREFRYVIYGENGFEYVQELWGSQFRSYSDGYYGYVLTSRFPRDSRWLGIRVERRQTMQQGGPWQQVADFKFRNPSTATIQPWVADPTPITRTSDGLNFVLGDVTVKTIPHMSNDIWNHVVSAPMEVRSNGILLTNWSARFVWATDASGNWDMLASHRSLDPRSVWKLEADFQPQSEFSAASLATIGLPPGSSTITTNVMNVPVTISWDGNWVEASIPTNDAKVALRFVGVADDAGATNAMEPSGSWNQFRFRMGSFMARKANVLTMDFKPTKVTFAVVPNVHATFFTKPQLLDERVKQ